VNAAADTGTVVGPARGGARGAGAIIRAGAATDCRPWPRFVLGAEAWAALAAAADDDEAGGAALLALWAEPGVVHAAFQEEDGAVLLASCAAPEGRYAALSPAWPAAPFERAVRDLWGLSAAGGADARPFVDHGRWAVSAPLSAQPLPRSGPPLQPEFRPPAAGDGLHQSPLGPVRPVPLGAVHLRVHALGGTVREMEAQGGYGHRGLVGLMLGRSPRAAARVAARVAVADGAVAHALAFARAAEAATGTVPPPRAVALRALMGELERIAGHLRWWGGVCAAAGLAWPEARCAVLREGVLRAAGAAFGHRLMLDRVVPGGVAADLGRDGPGALHEALAAVAAALPELEGVAENHAGLRDRLAGRVATAPALVARLGAGGPVGRAAGRGADARRLPGGDGWAAALGLVVPVLAAGDAEARQRVLLAEIRASLGLAQALLDGMPPPGEVLAPWPQRGGEGVGVVEGPRGLCLHWLALDGDGQIRAAFALDPAWGHWPLLAAAMAGAPASELPLAERSLACSASGVDL
jgi:Ni,Fe-hydrogenase III large subunit